LPDGRQVNLDGLLSMLSKRAAKADILVQKHLQNHPVIAAMADKSLLTMRVITCLNENAEPEVTLAMLRLLTKLEPQWKKYAKDMEYANPVNLATGTLGSCTGDSLYTSHLRYDRHPVTFENMLGRQMPYWRETQELALAAHAALNHRMTVGWDIAITPEGPVLLEGNTNYDVMFLQRVHNQPIGHTRLGELLNFHIGNFMANQQGEREMEGRQMADFIPSMMN
jgi:Sugar-transfer associated ATP-grasp